MKHIEIIHGDKVLSNIYSGGSVKDIAPLLRCYDNIFIILDQNLSHLVPELTATVPVKAVYTLEATEENKDIRTVMDICAWLLGQHADRNAFLLGVGGGITTDLTGMAASIYKRGIRFGFLPTTLLAQTDAAIGGKNGVNYQGFKNIVGVIRQPEFTFECAEVLSTLPYEDFLSGTGELLKSFLIEDCPGPDGKSTNYQMAVQFLSGIFHSDAPEQTLSRHTAEMTRLIMEAASVKAAIVGRDPEEKEERKKLNLGHTFAHAIEWKSHNQIPHGKAVAIGILLAARLSEHEGIAGKGLADRLEQDFKACGLPTTCPYKMEELSEAIVHDKKADNGQIHFVLLRTIGDVVLRKAPASILREAFPESKETDKI